MTAEKSIVKAYLEAVFGTGDEELLRDLVAHDAVIRVPYGTLHGPDGVGTYVKKWRKAFPPFTVIVHDVLAEENMVAVRWRTTGFHEGEFMGIAPTGYHVRVEVMGFFLVQHGQITEGWVIDDHFSLRCQLLGE